MVVLFYSLKKRSVGTLRKDTVHRKPRSHGVVFFSRIGISILGVSTKLRFIEDDEVLAFSSVYPSGWDRIFSCLI